MIKYNTNRGDIFLIKIRKTKTKELIWYWMGLHAIFPQGYGTHVQGSSSCLAILLPVLTTSVF